MSTQNARQIDPALLEGLDEGQRADFLAKAAAVREQHAASPEPKFRRAPDGSKRPVSGDADVIPLHRVKGAVARRAAESDGDWDVSAAAVKGTREWQRAGELLQQAEAAERAAFREHRASKRHLAYLKQRNPKYANASYGMLRPSQNPRGLISRWYDSDRRTLLLAGLARTGKTTAAHAITNHAHAEKKWVEAWRESELIKALQKEGAKADGRREDTTNMGMWERVTRCDLLYLEDMGRSRPSDWWLGTLWELLDLRQAREAEGLRMIVTANTPKEPKAAYATLVERYDDPIVDRMIDGGGLVMFDGPAIRDFKTDW